MGNWGYYPTYGGCNSVYSLLIRGPPYIYPSTSWDFQPPKKTYQIAGLLNRYFWMSRARCREVLANVHNFHGCFFFCSFQPLWLATSAVDDFFMFFFQHNDFGHPADYHRVKVPKSNRFLIARVTVICWSWKPVGYMDGISCLLGFKSWKENISHLQLGISTSASL